MKHNHTEKISFTVCMISPVFLFTIFLIRDVVTFIYLRVSQIDLYHIDVNCEERCYLC